MSKFLLALLLALSFFGAQAQPLGNKNGTVRVLGKLQVDSAEYLIKYRNADSSLVLAVDNSGLVFLRRVYSRTQVDSLLAINDSLIDIAAGQIGALVEAKPVDSVVQVDDTTRHYKYGTSTYWAIYNPAPGTIDATPTNGSSNAVSSDGVFDALVTKLSNITGLISAGTNVSLTGSGTPGSPYVISSTGGGGGGGGGEDLDQTLTIGNTTDNTIILNPLEADALTVEDAGSTGRKMFITTAPAAQPEIVFSENGTNVFDKTAQDTYIGFGIAAMRQLKLNAISGGTGQGTLQYINSNTNTSIRFPATGSNQDVAYQTYVASQLSGYAPLASPALTGTPTAPTAASGNNTTQIATTAFVTSAVAAGGSYTDEQAQDAVGSIINSTLTYVDATPVLGINLSNPNIWGADQSVPDEAYTDIGWDASLEVPTKNAIRDKIVTMPTLAGNTFTGAQSVPDDAYSSVGWNGSNEVPTKNAIRDKIESMGGGGGPISVFKTADETVNNSNTFQDDDHLSFAVDANSTYFVQVFFVINSASATADFKAQWTYPTGTTFVWAPVGDMSSTSASTTQSWARTGTSVARLGFIDQSVNIITAGAVSGTWGMMYNAVITTSSTSGTMQLQWAQNAATAEDTKLLKGTNIRYQKVQ